MKESNENTQTPTMTLSNAIALAMLFIEAHCLLPTLLFRRLGTRGDRIDNGIPTLLAVVYVPMFWSFAFSDHPHAPRSPQMLALAWFGLLGLLILHKSATLRAQRLGAAIHSRCVGVSVFVCRGYSPKAAHNVLEPLGCILLGMVVSFFDSPLAMYFVVAAALIRLPTAFIEVRDQRLAQDMVDAYLQQEHIGGLARERLKR